MRMLERLWNSNEEQWSMAFEECAKRVEKTGKTDYAVLDRCYTCPEYHNIFKLLLSTQ
jgi:hypothetical protein